MAKQLRVIAWIECLPLFKKKKKKKENTQTRRTLKPKPPKLKHYFCRVKLSNQPPFLLLPSSASVCSDDSFLVSSWAYESREIAWVGTSFSTVSFVSIFNENK